jgi:PAS domain S-box-containing protein
MDSYLSLESVMQHVIEQAGIGYSIQSASDQSIRWSSLLEQFYGLPVGTFAGTFEAFINLVYEEDRDYVRHECYRAMRPIAQVEPTRHSYYSFTCRPGSDPQRWFQHQGQWRWSEQGRLLEAIEVVSDVSVLRRTQGQLLDPDGRLDGILQASAVLILQIDSEGVIGDVLPCAQKGLGLLFWDALGKNLSEFLPPADRPALQLALTQWAAGKPTPLRFACLTDPEGVIEAVGNLPSSASGRTGIVLTLREVTHQAAIEAKLLAQKQRLQSVLHHPTVALFRCATDSERRVELIGDAIASVSGYPAQTFLGESGLLQLCHPDDRAQLQMTLWDAIAHSKPYQLEYRIRTREGQLRWVAEQGHPVVDPPSKDVYLEGMIWDISEFKAQLAEQQHCHSLLATLIESTADGILAIDIEANLSHYNQKFLEMWGLSREAIEALDDWQLVTFMAGQMSDPNQFWHQVRQEALQPELVGHGWINFKDGRRLERYSFPHWLEDRIVGRVISYRERG